MNTLVPFWRKTMSDDPVSFFFKDFDRAFAPVFTGSDIEETDDHYLVSLEIPGAKKEKLSVEVKNNQLMVTGEKRSGKFSRAYELPNTVDLEKIEAHYEDGILEIILPKTAASMGRKIDIKTEKTGLWHKLIGGTDKEKSEVAS